MNAVQPWFSKFILLFLINSTVSCFSVHAQAPTSYEKRLSALIENGVINQQEAEKQMSLLQSDDQSKFHQQVRDVASKIKHVKIYELTNEPIEIPAKAK